MEQEGGRKGEGEREKEKEKKKGGGGREMERGCFTAGGVLACSFNLFSEFIS